jgi:AmmeMemoRadiSam system protein B
MMMTESSFRVRPAAVAGAFYPAGEGPLRRQLTQLFEDSVPPPGSAPKVLIVPHAGYVYSGATAAQAYGCLQAQRSRIKRVVLLGPAHRVYVPGMALPSVDRFATPLGEVVLDQEMLAAAAALPGVVVDDSAHALEHSLEVQLPFLQTVLRDFTLVPVLVGDARAREVAAVIDALWDGPETLVVVSTDLSHFHGYDVARALDARTCERILRQATDLEGDDACGARVLNGLFSTDHVSGRSVELLAMCNSGDTAGDRERVVGYAAFAIH